MTIFFILRILRPISAHFVENAKLGWKGIKSAKLSLVTTNVNKTFDHFVWSVRSFSLTKESYQGLSLEAKTPRIILKFFSTATLKKICSIFFS